MKKKYLALMLSAGLICAFAPWGSAMPHEGSTSDTVEFRVHTFEECAKEAGRFWKENTDDFFFRDAETTKSVVYLGGDDQPALYEFLFENEGIRLGSVTIDVFSGRFIRSPHIFSAKGNLDEWKKKCSKDGKPIAYFEYALLRARELEKERGIQVKENYKLYSLCGWGLVVFEGHSTGRKIVASLTPSSNLRFPSLDDKGFDFEVLKKKDIGQCRESKKKMVEEINKANREYQKNLKKKKASMGR